jgi:hypothetical protein
VSYLPGDMHVIWREDIQHWCARSHRGDYGISPHKTKATATAISAMATSRRYPRLLIHRKSGAIEQILPWQHDVPPTPQDFQDDVP